MRLGKREGKRLGEKGEALGKVSQINKANKHNKEQQNGARSGSSKPAGGFRKKKFISILSTEGCSFKENTL